MNRVEPQQKTATESGKSGSASTHPAFEWVRSEHIDTLNLTVEEYRHRKTGAQHFHLAADNPENVFLVALRTVPMDSTGVAHMLEHTALCGSERYPVRDPFFMMIRRSLNTFMNAFTSSDWTAYPFASQNRKDFYNLMDVYLDAVFFSRLHELDFAQEGHRVEFEKPDDPETDLVFKGVVFNEMKGSMSSTVNTLWQTLTGKLFPTTTYHYNSGGEPANIPDLSYEELREFYKTHYHPSNAIFMTYGDIPARDHHAVFEDRALGRFEKLDKIIDVDEEKRFTQPQTVVENYALDEAEAEGDKTHVVMGWLLGNSADAMALMKAHLLSSVLLDNGASPLRHALETTDLGAAPSPLCGLEDSNREMSFMCGLEGAKPENSEAIERLIISVIQDVADNGVHNQITEAVLHQLELSQREIKGDGYPYGLQLILEGLSPAIHRGDPVALLNLDPVLEQLRQDIKNPDFIKQLARELLLDNAHRVRLTMTPDTGLSKQREAVERTRLQLIKDNLSDDAKQEIVQQAAALATRQEEKDDPGVLPKVSLEDIPAELNVVEGKSNMAGKVPVAVYTQGTNGLVYEQLVIKLPELNPQQQAMLPHYSRCLTELGSGGRDYMDTQVLMDAVTGGLGASTTIRGAINDEQNVSGYFILSGKALVRNQANLTGLMVDTMDAIRWDELARIRELVAQDRARAEQSVTGSGHGLAMLAASSGMSPAAELSHRLSGLEGIHRLKKLDDGLDKKGELERFVEGLQQLHQLVWNSPRQLMVVGEKDSQPGIMKVLAEKWQVTTGTFKPFRLSTVRRNEKQIWITSTQVNFCAKSYPAVPIEHEDAAALTVLGGFLRNGYLHRAIREQGGAYGGGASYDSDIAAFRFFSYRDPRFAETLEDFDRSVDWLLNEKHEWRQVEEAILGVIGGIDKPGSPAGEAKKTFHNSLFGRTSAQRQQFRSRVLDVTLDDLRRVGQTYLQPNDASIAAITNAATHKGVADLGLELHQL
ncbi:MAG: insulinase family protein [Acidiferrobacterales bacterium]